MPWDVGGEAKLTVWFQGEVSGQRFLSPMLDTNATEGERAHLHNYDSCHLEPRNYAIKCWEVVQQAADSRQGLTTGAQCYSIITHLESLIARANINLQRKLNMQNEI